MHGLGSSMECLFAPVPLLCNSLKIAYVSLILFLNLLSTPIRTFSMLFICPALQWLREQTREQGDDIRTSLTSDDKTIFPKIKAGHR